jgi:fluoroquinolone transport system permease protein
MNKFIYLSATDFKLVFRDPSLRIFIAMPLAIFVIILVALPNLVSAFDAVKRFVPIILMGATLQTSTMFGFIYCMVLIHEKDIQVAKVYGVLPVSKTGYVVSRLLIPTAISSLFTFALLLVQPFYTFDLLSMILLSMLCGLIAPLLTLVVTIFSKNKMEGMTWFKLINLLVSIPLAAFFISKYTFLFGIIPTHWIFQALSNMVAGESTLISFSIGFGYTFLLLILVIKRFAKVHFV